jgi:hypothetical protein
VKCARAAREADTDREDPGAERLVHQQQIEQDANRVRVREPDERELALDASEDDMRRSTLRDCKRRARVTSLS